MANEKPSFSGNISGDVANDSIEETIDNSVENVDSDEREAGYQPIVFGASSEVDSNRFILREFNEFGQDQLAKIREAADLFSKYNTCLRLIESSSIYENFNNYDTLENVVSQIGRNSRVSNKMKLRCMLINKDNARTFQILQNHFELDLNATFYLGKMNLLHIACDSGWKSIVGLLLSSDDIDVNCPTPSLRPSSLTPLMFGAMRGHLEVVKLLLEHPRIRLEAADSYGMTAIFHAANHGVHRVGDGLGYFRRLWSWDLSPQQLEAMEVQARTNAVAIIRLLLQAGCDLDARDNTGASVLNRAASVDNFSGVVTELINVGCKPTENVLNWTRVRNSELVPLLQQEMTRPPPLRRQARKAVWRRLRTCAAHQHSQVSFSQRISNMEGEILPSVLVEYLECKHQ